MRMYDYSDQYIQLEEMLANGEIDQELYNDTLESFSFSASTKAENLGKMIDNFKGQAQMYKDEADRLTKKRKTLENSIEWLTSSLETFLTATGKESLDAGLYKLGYKKLPDIVEFINEDSIPLAYKEKIVVTKISKREIAKALKDGEKVRGAKLVTGRRKFEVKK